MTLLSTGAPPPAPPSEISHPSHPEHNLTLVPTGQEVFNCNGCRENVTGANRYTCKTCNFDLHEACNLAEGTRLVHPLLPKRTFELRLEAPRSSERCSACGAHVKGIHYHCGRKNLYLHPCCAKLPMEIPLGDQLTFELVEKGSNCCTECRKGGGVRDYWFYSSTAMEVYLHVSCAKEGFLLPGSSSTEPDVDDHGRLARFVNDTASRKHKHGPGKSGQNLEIIFDIIKALTGSIIAVLTGNPLPIIAAGIDLCSTLSKLKIK
ncbi:hypothetical protein ZWY2020_012691 [Hordeum vulgare]|nr:hypothetical protein ZWY2020_012691 [Hordeum vulgare]